MCFFRRKIKESEETLEALDLAIQQAHNRLIILNSKIENGPLVCSICCENKIDTALIPCGHLFCNNCVKGASNCFFCRKNISQQQKIFLN